MPFPSRDPVAARALVERLMNDDADAAAQIDACSAPALELVELARRATDVPIALHGCLTTHGIIDFASGHVPMPLAVVMALHLVRCPACWKHAGDGALIARFEARHIRESEAALARARSGYAAKQKSN